MRAVPETERYVADTHAIIWHISSSPRLSTEARRRFLMADKGEAIVYVSVMTSIELLYLCEKGKIASIVSDQFHRAVRSDPRESYQMVDLTYELAGILPLVPRTMIPELPDRVIVATALHLKLPLITKDERIRKWEDLVTVW